MKSCQTVVRFGALMMLVVAASALTGATSTGSDVKTTWLFPKHDPHPKAWAFVTVEPVGKWTAPVFDESAWEWSSGGLGNGQIAHDCPDAQVATSWTTPALWLRRHFNYTKNGRAPSRVCLEMFHDEDVVVYLNGVELLSRKGYTTSYEPFEIPVEKFNAAVREGDNVLAVKVVQTTGGQYFDAGLSVGIKTP